MKICVLVIALAAATGTAHRLPSHARGGLAQELLDAAMAHPTINEDKKWWSAPVDHADASSGTYEQKYYEDNTYWKGPGYPVFLEIGGEGPINSSPGGYLAELAEEHSALLVVLEHRFYGESIPNGNVDTDNLKLLTVENALGDLAGFVAWYTKTVGATGSPWVAFGGSYPGALSAWFRVAYPDLTIGSLSSSGVVNSIFNFPQFDERVATAVGDECAAKIRMTTAAADRAVSNENKTVGAEAKALFGCSAEMWDPDWMYMMADSIAMADQYGSKSVLCAAMAEIPDDASDMDLLSAVANFTSSFWGEDFATGCFYDSSCLADPEQYEVGATDRSWRWQKCYELAYLQTAPLDEDGSTSSTSLRSGLVDLEYVVGQCARVFGAENAVPTTDEINSKYGGATTNVANVFFSDFSDDPWREASVTKTPSNPTSTFFLVECDDCGHCMDFHSSSEDDPQQLKDERTAFGEVLSSWLAGFAALYH